jgi:hypothetical protein
MKISELQGKMSSSLSQYIGTGKGTGKWTVSPVKHILYRRTSTSGLAKDRRLPPRIIKESDWNELYKSVQVPFE